MTVLNFVKLFLVLINSMKGSSNVDSQGIRRACLGDELMLTCETYGTALTWTVTPNRDTNRSTTTISVLASNAVNFSRSVMILNNELKFTSTIQESQLLVSLLQIDNVSANISGALIQCATSEEQVHSTIIYIVGNDHHLSTNVTTVTESGAENVTVMFEWVTVDEDPLIRNEGPTYEYAMEVSPQALTRSISNNSACLVLQYNVLYTVKIVVCLCGQSNVVINSTLYYPDTNTKDLDYDLSGTINNDHHAVITVVSTASSDVNIDIILGSSVGLAFIVITVTVVMIGLVIIVVTKRGSLCWHKAKSDGQDFQLTDNDQSINKNVTDSLSMGQYSLLQTDPVIQTHDATPNSSQQRTITYADIGSLAFQKKSDAINASVFQFGDSGCIEYAKISHKTLPSEVEHSSKPQCHPDSLLNLDCLLIQIKSDITPHWYQFGKAIGVEEKVLNKCQQCPSEESIIEVCDHWLRYHSGKPTWREVAEALRIINFQQLAFDIEQVYNNGKLPSIINDHIDIRERQDSEMISDPQASMTELPPPLPPRLT